MPDVIHGVSMQEPGVRKFLLVDFRGLTDTAGKKSVVGQGLVIANRVKQSAAIKGNGLE